MSTERALFHIGTSAPAATTIPSYASDGAFEAAKGSSGDDGDRYYNTTLEKYRFNENGTWRTIATLDGTETFTNKTLDGVSYEVIAAQTGTYVMLATDYYIPLNAASAVTVTPLDAATYLGKVVVLRKTDSSFNAVTITGVTTLNTQGETVTIMSDGTSWNVISRFIPSEWATAPAPANTTANTTRDAFQWRREGDSARIRLGYTATADATNDWADMEWEEIMPSGLTVDTAKLAAYAAGEQADKAIVGVFSAHDVGTGAFTGTVSIEPSSSDFFLNLGGGPGFTVASGDGLTFEVLVPVTGWKG